MQISVECPGQPIVASEEGERKGQSRCGFAMGSLKGKIKQKNNTHHNKKIHPKGMLRDSHREGNQHCVKKGEEKTKKRDAAEHCEEENLNDTPKRTTF